MKLASPGSTKVAALLLIPAFLVAHPSSCLAQKNSVLHTYSAGNWATQAFLCDSTLGKDDCTQEVATLKSHLQAYPVAQLGSWTWVVIPSDRWRELGFDTASPAYTALEDRLTLIDESMLFQRDATRTEELMAKFERSLPEIVDFAVTHEMGHALCGFKEEGKADEVGRRLREGKLPYCSIPGKVRERFPVKMRADVWGGTETATAAGSK